MGLLMGTHIMVCRFFAGYRVRPDGIHFVMHADGRPSGMAFVEFDCPQEAMRALVSKQSPALQCQIDLVCQVSNTAVPAHQLATCTWWTWCTRSCNIIDAIAGL